jgi:hypothetical protein
VIFLLIACLVATTKVNIYLYKFIDSLSNFKFKDSKNNSPNHLISNQIQSIDDGEEEEQNDQQLYEDI